MLRFLSHTGSCPFNDVAKGIQGGRMREACVCARFIVGLFFLLWAADVVAALTVGNRQLISATRVGRVIYEITYRVDLTNTGPSVTNATATVTSTSPDSVIVDGALDFGDVPAGATITSTDTFSFRQNRLVAFDPTALHYAVSATPVSGDITPPQISISMPDGTQVDTASVTISGTATDETALAGVTVNGVSAILSANTFTLSVPLIQGDNPVTAIATDTAGNTAAASIIVTRIAPLPAPKITSVTPGSATAGDLVSIAGSNFAARSGSAPLVMLNQQGGGTVNAPVASFDAANITLSVPPSAASGNVTVSVNGQTAVSADTLTIMASGDFALSPNPAGVTLIQGANTSVDVRISGSGSFSQAVDLSVSGVPAGITAAFTPRTIAAGQPGALTLTAPAGQATGFSTLHVSATAIVGGIALSRSADVTLNVQPVTTSFVGRTVVADPTETPLAGVTVELLGLDGAGGATGCNAQTASDAAGNFAFTNLPPACVGEQLIRYDGSTVTSPAGEYAGVDLNYRIVDGQVSVSPVLVHLPRIDNGETVMVVQNNNTDQTFRFSSIPNLSITVYAGTTLTMADGARPNPFPLTAVRVPIDRLPDEMPADNGLTPFIVAFQPANGDSSQPIAVTFPNTVDTPPATTVALMTLDPTQGKMVSYGTGTVSDDGLRIDPDPDPARLGKRYGLVHFDWHGPSGPSPNQIDPCPNGPCGGDPVHFASGLVVDRRTDIAIPAPGGGISIRRTYRYCEPWRATRRRVDRDRCSWI
ncbi:MAG: hypothetical protein GC138_01250 [Gammaproteobacteria bacterium]|nr:hypothetical protein [Gammaproteobacteria bacterium]